MGRRERRNRVTIYLVSAFGVADVQRTDMGTFSMFLLSKSDRKARRGTPMQVYWEGGTNWRGSIRDALRYRNKDDAETGAVMAAALNPKFMGTIKVVEKKVPYNAKARYVS